MCHNTKVILKFRIKFRCRVFAKGPIYTENEQTIFRLLVGDETGFLHVVMIDISYHNTIQVFV